MIICLECRGSGFLQNGNEMTPPNQGVFTDKVTVNKTVCTSCLGNKYMQGGSI